ncbi:MAG: sigma 54-interacting transcriptional regulator [Deltaproteobacteria bacterium]|nr:sigma 54-interacting transcriptional regulator [Deltaproteobacteria bacterium]
MMGKEAKYNRFEKINIVTPGLINKVFEFLAHLEVSEENPILISGPTGVGKSLFLNVLINFLRIKKKEVRIINCAHFDSNLVDSLLFGYVRGSFTGALSDRGGWLEESNGRTLVLDEIGELPENVQAKLLTFMEDGVYYKVGSTNIETADVRIVGVTSRKGQLREEFYNRFFEFGVPPLYKRRADMLFYMAVMAPDIFEMLTPLDILMMLAYNWPGNVRELKNFILSLRRRDKKNELKKMDTYPRIGLITSELSEYASWPSPDRLIQLCSRLKKSKIDDKLLGSTLNSFGIGLEAPLQKNEIFKGFNLKKIEEDPQFLAWREHLGIKQIEDQYNLKFLFYYRPFYNVYNGFELFCFLFFQDHCDNKDLLCVDEPGIVNDFILSEITDKDENFEKIIDDLRNEIFGFLAGINLPSHISFAESYEDKMPYFVSELLVSYPENRFLNAIADKISLPEIDIKLKTDIWSMTLQELEVYYLTGLIEQCDGNKTKAAKKTGIKYSTFNSRMKKLKDLDLLK